MANAGGLLVADWPVLVWMYARLSISEERDSLKRFGEAYGRYMAEVPRFVPRSRRAAGASGARQ